MLLKVNLRHLDQGPTELEGELPLAEFLGDFKDELVRIVSPISYSIAVERDGEGLVIRGRISTDLSCDCARCLKTFPQKLEMKDFLVVVPLEGDDAPTRDGDFADLTPYVRTDTFLALPTKPLCNPDCRGLPQKATARDSRLETEAPKASPWVALDRLKL
jgi:uncharacterized metal-binding protein YceD (DUF177 family)